MRFVGATCHAAVGYTRLYSLANLGRQSLDVHWGPFYFSYVQMPGSLIRQTVFYHETRFRRGVWQLNLGVERWREELPGIWHETGWGGSLTGGVHGERAILLTCLNQNSLTCSAAWQELSWLLELSVYREFENSQSEISPRIVWTISPEWSAEVNYYTVSGMFQYGINGRQGWLMWSFGGRIHPLLPPTFYFRTGVSS